jgi:CelD/BcsL family acetyltransferase involved in cellulose biosynthesis
MLDVGLAMHNCVITCLDGPDPLRSLRGEWDDLWQASIDATESQTSVFISDYSHHLNQTAPTVVVARDSSGTCVAAAAFSICRDRVSLRRKLAFVGDKAVDYHVIVARPGLPVAIGARMLEHMYGRFRRRVPSVELANVPAQTWTGESLREWAARAESNSAIVERWRTETFAVALPKTLEDYVRRLGPGARHDFRYYRRRVQRDFQATFRVITRIEDLGEGLEAIEAVDRARWGSGSRFRAAEYRQFARRLAEHLCAAGMYRAFILYLDGRPAAFVYGSVVRNEFKVTAIGRDPGIAGKYSIGTVTNNFAIERCIEDGLAAYDLTRGAEEYKKWLGATARVNEHVRLYRSRVDRTIERLSRVAADAARSRPWLRQMARYVRGAR